MLIAMPIDSQSPARLFVTGPVFIEYFDQKRQLSIVSEMANWCVELNWVKNNLEKIPVWMKGIRWTGLIACSVLYGAIYIAVRYPLPANYIGHTQLGLLLFVLPGALAALTSRQSPLTAMVIAIALASPPCLVLMQSDGFNSVGLGQEIAFIASAVFWCGSGTLGVMLWRTLMEIHHQQAGKGRL